MYEKCRAKVRVFFYMNKKMVFFMRKYKKKLYFWLRRKYSVMDIQEKKQAFSLAYLIT